MKRMNMVHGLMWLLMGKSPFEPNDLWKTGCEEKRWNRNL